MTKNNGVGVGLLCLFLAAIQRHWFENAMFSHMLLQLPLIVISGWLTTGPRAGCTATDTRCLQHLEQINAQGLTGLTTVLLVSAYWMVPRALELTLTHDVQELAKFGSLWLCGAILSRANRHVHPVTEIFFLGNFCAMSAIVGLLYQDQPQQLCNAYLVDDQVSTGIGLVVLSIAAAVAWAAAHFHRIDQLECSACASPTN